MRITYVLALVIATAGLLAGPAGFRPAEQGAEAAPTNDKGGQIPVASPTPTPTKQPEPGDTDGDGCSDQQENGPDANQGGRRNYLYEWDFYDVNGDMFVNIPGDILGVAQAFGRDDPDYTPQKDRSPGPPPGVDPDDPNNNEPWDLGPPDGVINIPDDILGVAKQFGHRCESTPTPTPLPGGDVTIRNSTWQEGPGFFGVAIEIFGEVLNGRNHSVAFVEVTANAYSASNTLLTTESGLACVRSMAPGTDSPFDIFIFGPPPDIDHIELSVTDFAEPPFFFDPPVVGMDTVVTNVFTDTGDSRHVVGTVTNNSSFTYDFIDVCTAHYDSSGNVVRTALDFLRPDTLAPGQSGKFNASAFSSSAGIVSDRVWVDAGYTDASPPPVDSMTIRNSSWHEGGFFGEIEVVGEVVNDVGNDVALVQVTANAYSASNTLLTTESGIACVSSMAPGTDSPFDILIFFPPPGIDHIQVSVTDLREAPFLFFDPPVVGLDPTITNVFTDFIDFRHVVGTVTNNSSFTYDFINVCAAFYDGSGNVVRTALDFLSPDMLGPGATGSFDASAHTQGVDVVSERVWVDASYE